MPGKRDMNPSVGSRSKKGGCGMPSCDGKAREQFMCPCRKYQYCTRQCMDYYQLQHGADCTASVDREKERLCNAAKVGDVSLIRLILGAEVVTIDSAKEDGMTPLCFSAQSGHLHAVQYMLREGCSLACSQKAVQCAQGNQEIIDAILDEPRRRAEEVAAKKPVAKANEKPPSGTVKTSGGSGLSLPPPLHTSTTTKGEKKAGDAKGTDSGGRGEDGKFNKTKAPATSLSVVSTMKKPIVTFQPERGTESKSSAATDHDKSSPEAEEKEGVDGEDSSGDSGGGDSDGDNQSAHEEPPPPEEEAVTLPSHCKWGQPQPQPTAPPPQPPSSISSEIRDINAHNQIHHDDTNPPVLRKRTEEKLLVCPVCTYHNPSTFLICGACDTKFDQDVAVVYVSAPVATPTPATTSFTLPSPPVAVISQPPPLTATVRERGPPAMPTGAVDNHYNTNLPPGLGLGLGRISSSSAAILSSQMSSQMSSQNSHGYQPTATPTPSSHSHDSNGQHQIFSQQQAAEASAMRDKVAALEIEVARLKAQSLINELEMSDLKAQGVRDAQTITGLNRRLLWLEQQLQQGSAWMGGLFKQYQNEERIDGMDIHSQGSLGMSIGRSHREAGPR